MTTARQHIIATNRAAAAEAYAKRQANIAQQMVDLQACLQIHQDRQSEDSRNWGFAGDLSEVERLLGDALRMLGMPQQA